MSAPVVQTSDQPFRRVTRPTVVAGAIDALIVIVWFARRPGAPSGPIAAD